jgi:hypothetical protein
VRSLVALIAATIPAVPAAAGPCAMRPMVPAALGTASAVAPDGGVVVALMPSLDFGGTGGVVANKDWRFKDVNQLVVPAAIRTIAPGLAVYELPATGGANVQLVDGAGKVVADVGRAMSKQAALGAPKLKAVVRKDSSTPPGPRSYTSSDVIARFAANAPGDAVAVVLFTADTHTPLSWTALAVAPTPNEQIVYHRPFRCESSVPGFVEASVGDHVVVAWLDKSGRLSPFSNEVVVGR